MKVVPVRIALIAISDSNLRLVRNIEARSPNRATEKTPNAILTKVRNLTSKQWQRLLRNPEKGRKAKGAVLTDMRRTARAVAATHVGPKIMPKRAKVGTERGPEGIPNTRIALLKTQLANPIPPPRPPIAAINPTRDISRAKRALCWTRNSSNWNSQNFPTGSTIFWLHLCTRPAWLATTRKNSIRSPSTSSWTFWLRPSRVSTAINWLNRLREALEACLNCTRKFRNLGRGSKMSRSYWAK